MTTPLPQLPSRPIGGISSLIAGNRLECRPRSAEFNRSLRAEVRDAAWMLSRQWQLKEFRAEDRGQPVVAEVDLEYSRLNQFRLGNQDIVQFDGGLLPLPLDALVQAQQPEIDAGLRLQMGHHWERLLRAASLGATLGSFRAAYSLSAAVAPTSGYDLAYGLAITMSETTELLLALAGKAIDGYQLYRDLLRDAGKAADTAGLPRTSTTGIALIAQAGQFTQWYARVYTLPEAGGAAWLVSDLEYKFEAAAPTSSGTPATVEAREHTGGTLDWYSVDENPSASGYENTDGVAISKKLSFVPTEIQFGGAPNARWWEFEDRKVDFGKLTADTSDFGRMLLQEFMFLYQNDWFSLPYAVPAGSLCTVLSVHVTDVFGQRYRIQPAGYSGLREPDTAQTPVDLDWGRWGLYALSQKGNRRQSVPRLLLPPTAVAPQVGKPVEQVLLLREEATNVVWGVEQTISDGQGRGMDGAGAAARLTEYLRSQVPNTPPLPALAKLEYQLATPVAEHWIPFVPRPNADTDEYELLQGEMVRRIDGLDDFNPGDDTVKPRTTLLKLIPSPQEYVLREHTVPPNGVRVDSAFRRARWYNGETVLWYGRSLGPGRSAGSSGLAYDQLLPRTVRTEAAQFGLYAAVMDPVASPAKVSRVRLHPDVNNVLEEGIRLEKTRAQLIAMLQAQDTVHVIYRNTTSDPWTQGVELVLVTVNNKVYIKRAGAATTTEGDELGPNTIPVF